MNKRNLISALVLSCFAMGAQAQGAAYPNKPIRLVVGFAPTDDIVDWVHLAQEAEAQA